MNRPAVPVIAFQDLSAGESVNEGVISGSPGGSARRHGCG
jgi:hypothetical protein